MTLKLDVRNDFGLTLFSVDDSGQIIFEPISENIGIKNTNPQRTLDITGSLGVDSIFLDGATENSVLVFGTSGAVIANSALTFDGTTLTANTLSGALTSSSVTITGGAISNTTIGATNPTTGAFTTVSASGQITSTVTTGTAPLVIASTTQVANLNASQLIGGTWAAPGTIGSTTANTGAFTALTATTLRTADGSAAVPAHSFTNKTTTGAFLTTDSTYAISVEGTKTVEFGVAAQGDSLLEIYDEDDELIFAVNPLDTNQPILQVLNAVGDVLIDASANSVTIGKDTDIDGVLTFANGSIVNVVSDLAAGESANSAAIVSNIIRIDQDDYDALVSPDPDTLYVIV
jgi:hypothetical protein